MSVKQHLVTAEELWDMPEVPGKRFELVEGAIAEVSPAGGEHTWIMFMLAKRLDAFVKQHDLGIVLPSGPGFVLRRDPDLVRVPDVSIIVGADLPTNGLPEGFWKGAPTLAVEIVSPDDLAYDVDNRVHDYLDAGSRQVWILWPAFRSASVRFPGGHGCEFGPEATLDGGEMLPGFSVTVGDLFEIR